MPYYFNTPNLHVALNAKCASASVSRALINAFYPDVKSSIENAAYPTGKGPDSFNWHMMCPGTNKPDRPVVVLVRDVVDRFCSGVAYLNLDLDAALSSLATGEPIAFRKRSMPVMSNIHFAKQSRLLSGQTHLFRMPNHIPEFCQFIGIDQLEPVNRAPSSKPTLSEEQRSVVLSAYSEDVELFDSITQPNTTVIADINWSDEPEEEGYE